MPNERTKTSVRRRTLEPLDWLAAARKSAALSVAASVDLR
jgi:hypothetical protein